MKEFLKEFIGFGQECLNSLHIPYGSSYFFMSWRSEMKECLKEFIGFGSVALEFLKEFHTFSCPGSHESSNSLRNSLFLGQECLNSLRNFILCHVLEVRNEGIP